MLRIIFVLYSFWISFGILSEIRFKSKRNPKEIWEKVEKYVTMTCFICPSEYKNKFYIAYVYTP